MLLLIPFLSFEALGMHFAALPSPPFSILTLLSKSFEGASSSSSSHEDAVPLLVLLVVASLLRLLLKFKVIQLSWMTCFDKLFFILNSFELLYHYNKEFYKNRKRGESY